MIYVNPVSMNMIGTTILRGSPNGNYRRSLGARAGFSVNSGIRLVRVAQK